MLIFAGIAAILLLLISIHYTPTKTATENDRMIIGITFIFVNLIGIYSAFRPGQIRHIFTQKNSKEPSKRKSSETHMKIQGHHPTCNSFSNHVFQYKHRRYCTGCFGLALGSLIALLIIAGYIPFGAPFPDTILLLMQVIGLILIITNFIEVSVHHQTVSLHLISNGLLIIGFLLITISVLEKTGELSYGIIAIIFTLLWLDTRIHLSQFTHRFICQSCSSDCDYFY
jgi:hypothetical protein